MNLEAMEFPSRLQEGLGEGVSSSTNQQALPRPSSRSAEPPAQPGQRGALSTSNSQAGGEKKPREMERAE